MTVVGVVGAAARGRGWRGVGHGAGRQGALLELMFCARGYLEEFVDELVDI